MVWFGFVVALAVVNKEVVDLTAKAVQGATLTFEGVHNVHGSHSLPLGMLGVGDSVPDHVLQEHLEHPTGLLVDEARDALDAASASQTTDSRLGDALDVITQHFAVTLGSSLSKPLASFATASHDDDDPAPSTSSSQVCLTLGVRGYICRERIEFVAGCLF